MTNMTNNWKYICMKINVMTIEVIVAINNDIE